MEAFMDWLVLDLVGLETMKKVLVDDIVKLFKIKSYVDYIDFLFLIDSTLHKSFLKFLFH
jgi:hypothetical protein